jgi:hypothetical protein
MLLYLAAIYESRDDVEEHELLKGETIEFLRTDQIDIFVAFFRESETFEEGVVGQHANEIHEAVKFTFTPATHIKDTVRNEA